MLRVYSKRELWCYEDWGGELLFKARTQSRRVNAWFRISRPWTNARTYNDIGTMKANIKSAICMHMVWM